MNKALEEIKMSLKQGIAELVDNPPTDRKIPRQELLNRYWNIHQNQMIAGEINVMLFSGMDQNEKVGEMIRSIGPGVAPLVKDMFVKDEVIKWEKVVKENKNILEIIKVLEKEQ